MPTECVNWTVKRSEESQRILSRRMDGRRRSVGAAGRQVVANLLATLRLIERAIVRKATDRQADIYRDRHIYI